MSKDSRMGGKFTGSHTTCVPLAAQIADLAEASTYVTKINLGFITAGLRSANGRRRVKITDDGKSLLLSVRDNTSHQELRVYVTNLQEARLAVSRGVRNAGIELRFKDAPTR